MDAPSRWLPVDPPDPQAAKALAQQLGLSLRLAGLLLARDLCDPEAAQAFLRPSFREIPDPFSMKDAEKAALRLVAAIQKKERVVLYGDFDVDGVTSASLLSGFLKQHGLSPEVYIPSRLVEGYGLNQASVERFAAEKTDLLITLDCGITAGDEIERGNRLGLQTLVVDHHRCPESLPPAYATLNPQQEDCGYPDKRLAAVGVTFNLLIATRAKLREAGFYGEAPEPNLAEMLDLVALGTVADLVPLLGVNRIFTRFGLREMQKARRPGIRALLDVAEVSPKACDSAALAYRLGPRINAAGRLSDASVGVQLLMSESMPPARALAERLDAANESRKAIEAEVFAAAVEQVEAMEELPKALVLSDPAWHPGVIGIVCSKLVERYQRVSLLIGEGGRGSGRAAGSVHLYRLIQGASGFLTKFGGHRAAAGFRIEHGQIPGFRAAILEAMEAETARLNEDPPLYYDLEIREDELDEPLFEELMALQPFGMQNRVPRLFIPRLKLLDVRVVGQKHLKIAVEAGSRRRMDGIFFRGADGFEQLQVGQSIDLLAELEENHFRGRRSLQLMIRALRPSEASGPA